MMVVALDKKEMEEYVVMIRLNLYNRDLPCGSAAIREQMEIESPLLALPSVSMITRILRHNYLTHGRTGYYEGK
jgi:hypothetical protein